MMAVLFMAGCNGNKSDKPAANADSTEQANAQAQQDSTVYGVCMDGSMHHFNLKMDDGRVLSLQKDVDTETSVVFGGLLDGDELAVTYYINPTEQDTVATRAINLTTLRAHWRSLDRDFEIQKGGTIKSNQANESHPWTSWRIFNGHLVLGTDTFDVTMLNADSLYLEGKTGIYDYARVKEKAAN